MIALLLLRTIVCSLGEFIPIGTETGLPDRV